MSETRYTITLTDTEGNSMGVAHTNDTENAERTFKMYQSYKGGYEAVMLDRKTGNRVTADGAECAS